ncbi:MAG: hypothetical protein QW597_03675 [Thermoplasmataceae archaeon]
MERNNLMAVGAFVVISILLVGGLEFYNINEKPSVSPVIISGVQVGETWLKYDSSNSTVYANMTTMENYINVTVKFNGTVSNATLLVNPQSVHNSTTNATYPIFQSVNETFVFVKGIYSQTFSFQISRAVYNNMTLGKTYTAVFVVQTGSFLGNLLNLAVTRS